jgi:hypothetical protein
VKERLVMYGLISRAFYVVVLVILSLSLSLQRGMTQDVSPYFVQPQWSYNGNRIAVVEGSTILVYDIVSGGVIARLEGHTDSVLSVRWSPLDHRIASAGTDQMVKIWDTDTGTLLYNLTGHNAIVTMLVWSPDATQLISSALEGSPNFFVWDVQTGALQRAIDHGTIFNAAFSPDRVTLAISYSLDLALFDPTTFQVIVRQPYAMCCSNRMEPLVWSANSSQLLTGSMNGLITIWNATTLSQMSQFPANAYFDVDGFGIPDLNLSRVWDVAFGLNGTIEAVSGDGSLRQWDANGRLLQEMELGRLDAAAWSQHMGRLAVQTASTSAQSSDQTDAIAASVPSLHILTPFASPARLQAIAELCGAPMELRGQLDTAIASGSNTNIVAQVEALAPAVPPACAADLRAIAAAIQGE